MKNDFAFLYPPPRALRFHGAHLDMSALCFPLEIFKKYRFLFEHFSIRNSNRGLQVIFQERRGLAGEEYAIECGPERIVLSANHPGSRFYAFSTLLQILAFHEKSGRVPAFSLRDAPRIAFRGFMLCGDEGAVPDRRELRRLLLKLALLKFNHCALPAAAMPPAPDAVQESGDMQALAQLARASGMVIIWLAADDEAVFRFGPSPSAMDFFSDRPVSFAADESGDRTHPAGWFDFFLARHRQGRGQGKKTAVWGEVFLRHSEWIRKIPQNVLVLNRAAAPARPDFLRTAVLPFKKHHIAQVLCPELCGRDRFIPDARVGMDRVAAACQVAKAEKLAGVMLASSERDSRGCLPEGAAMLQFQAGCLLWSGRVPAPGAFSLWALGRDEPALFRVYSFLAQAEHRLPQAHGRYLFEDPLSAPFSRQGDPREVEAHFHKAALYLEKRKIAGGELESFLSFCRRLYEYIAVKVRLSARLGELLRQEGAGEALCRQAAWLEQEARSLKTLHLEVWRKHFQAGGPGSIAQSFDVLSERYAILKETACRPAGRANLLAELKNNPPLDGLPGGNL